MDINERIQAVRRECAGQPVDCYVLFSSNTDALQLFEAARAQGVAARISPTPRAARSSCGVSLLIPCEDACKVENIARDGAILFEDIVPLARQIDPHRDRYC